MDRVIMGKVRGRDSALVRMTKECICELEGDPKEYDVEVNFLEGY